MSYWYERIQKKHILIFLSSIPLLLISSSANTVASYSSGCLPTASRTLFDWISVDHSSNFFEVYPYVFMSFEQGCIEWLGFSTCESVQFQDWMHIWSETEIITVHIFNTTTTQGDNTETLETSLATLERQYYDSGSTVSPGKLELHRKMTYSLVAHSEELDTNFVVRNTPNREDAPWRQVTLGQLLGVSESPIVYVNTNPANEHASMIVPSQTNKNLRADSLLYFLRVPQNSRRCLLDDFCDETCSWNGLCEPIGYGHHGMLLPSATFFLDWGSSAGLGHWPTVGWNYYLFCPRSVHDPLCKREDPRFVIIFGPETSSRAIFQNTGDWPSEKYPLLEIQLWRERGYVRRNGHCDQVMIGQSAKYCNVPTEYVALEENVFLSRPGIQGIDQGLFSEIHSERVTGLRFYHNDVWQLNYRVIADAADNLKSSVFFPLFWMEKRSGTLKTDDKLQFAALKSYGFHVMTGVLISYLLFLFFNVMFFYLFFRSLACCEYMEAKDAAVPRPVFI